MDLRHLRYDKKQQFGVCLFEWTWGLLVIKSDDEELFNSCMKAMAQNSVNLCWTKWENGK